MDSLTTEVTIIGAGPAGLTLAAELASRGVQCCVLDKHTERLPQSRAFGLSPLTMQLLDTRSVTDTMLANGYACHFAPLGDGERRLQFSLLNTRFPFLLSINQEKTEEVLEQWALDAGAQIIKGATFECIHNNDDWVTISYSKNEKKYRLTSQYLIGCDGVNGQVGKQAGFEYSRIKYSQALMHADVHLSHPPPQRMYAKISRGGMVSIFPHKGDTYRMIVLDQDTLHLPVERELSLSEFQESAYKLSSIDFGIHDPLWLTRFSSQQKHALQYRKNRIFLAGDAAHTHMPAGGQGLQVSVHDAFNLGWKLASVIRHYAPEALLDSYETERRAVNQQSMARSRAFYRYEIGNDTVSVLLKWLINKLTVIPYFHRLALKELTGLSTNYHAQQKLAVTGHVSKQVGHFVEDLTVQVEPSNEKSRTRLYELLRCLKPVVLEDTYNTSSKSSLAERFGAHLSYAACPDLSKTLNCRLCLIRPDSVISWTGDNLEQLLASEQLSGMLFSNLHTEADHDTAVVDTPASKRSITG